jgi:hypothetical protein
LAVADLRYHLSLTSLGKALPPNRELRRLVAPISIFSGLRALRRTVTYCTSSRIARELAMRAADQMHTLLKARSEEISAKADTFQDVDSQR